VIKSFRPTPVLRAAGTTFSIRVIATGISYITLVALARWMGPEQYGAFSYANAWAVLLAFPAGLGLPMSCVRFIPEYVAQRNWTKARGILIHSITLMLSTSILLSVAGILFVLLFHRVADAYRLPLLIALAGVPAISFIALGAQVGRALGWIGLGYSVSQVWHPLAFLAVATVLVLGGRSLDASLMIGMWYGIAAIAVVVQGSIYFMRLAPDIRNTVSEFDRRLWLRIALPLLFVDGFTAVISYTDVLMIGAYREPSAVGYYYAAARIATLVLFFLQAVSSLVGPQMAQLFSEGKVEEVQSLVVDTAPWIFIPATLMTVAVIALGPFLLGIFGPGFVTAWRALIFLAIGNLALSITGPAALLLNMTGHQDTTAKVFGAAAAANVILNAILVPRFGLSGAAFATAVSTASMSSLLVYSARRKLGIHTSILAVTTRRASAAA
jgi:O-antigen/teichoic acid export membrane protein